MHMASQKGLGDKGESVTSMLNRVYKLTTQQIMRLTQMEINGVENYAKWVNKNYMGLNKRVIEAEAPKKLPEKIPLKILDKKEIVD